MGSSEWTQSVSSLSGYEVLNVAPVIAQACPTSGHDESRLTIRRKLIIMPLLDTFQVATPVVLAVVQRFLLDFFYPQKEFLMRDQDNVELKGKKSLPFFARLLEAQEIADVSGGAKTTKYPSDDDEVSTTMKYPSDGDEGGTEI